MNTDYREQTNSFQGDVDSRSPPSGLHLLTPPLIHCTQSSLSSIYITQNIIKSNCTLKSPHFFVQRNMQLNSTLLINCFHHIVAMAINVVLRSELLRILFRITTIAAKQSIRGAILIVLVSLILFLIKLIEPLTSIRKTMPRVLCGQMCEL